MKSIQIDLPDKLAEGLEVLVRRGWFRSAEEACRFALLDLLRHQHLELQEQFQRDDIAWALTQKDAAE